MTIAPQPQLRPYIGIGISYNLITIGIHLGYGMTIAPQPQLRPYIGIGISYNLITF